MNVVTSLVRHAAVLLVFALAACSAGTNPATVQSQLGSRPSAVCMSVTCGPGEGGGGGDTLSIQERIAEQWNSTTNSGTMSTYDDSDGSLIAAVSGGYASSNTLTTRVSVGGASYAASVTMPSGGFQYGINTLPNGTLTIDSSTNVITASVVAYNGDNYTITATPNPTTGGYSLVVDDTTTGAVERATVTLASTSASTSALTRVYLAGYGHGACGIEADASEYLLGVSGIAGGVAMFASMFGGPENPAALISLGVAGATGAIGGFAALLHWAGCPQ